MQTFKEAKCKYIYVGDGQNSLTFTVYEDLVPFLDIDAIQQI